MCVLTGDIVKSGALGHDAQEAVMAAVADAAAVIAGWPGVATVRQERFRGDGWQLVLSEPRWALRAALIVRASIRAACAEGETRLAAAVGRVRLGASLAASAGEAFEQSGQGMDALPVHRLWTLYCSPTHALGAPRAAGLAGALFMLCDTLSRRWTARQAAVFAQLGGPAPPRMIDVAKILGVQPQTVQTHFERAGGHALVEAAEAFEYAYESGP